jgi:heme-degrading monooxygenase HmoA
MFARVSQFSVPAERQEQALQAAEEHIGPSLRMQIGYLGDLLLGDRENGKMVTIVLWESEEAMHATDEASHWFRSFGAQETGGRVETVDHYEVYRAQNLGGTTSS